MITKREADAVVDFLNDLVAKDQQFVTALVAHRPVCNEKVAQHPTVQVGSIDGETRAGFLGVLNGLFGAFADGPYAGWGPIVAIYEGEMLSCFTRTDAFG